MNFFKKEKKCQKCGKIIPSNEDSYYGLCFECYKEYLIEQIKKIGQPLPPKEPFSFKNLPKKILNYIKNLFIDF